jgi:hypothetical protein
METPKKDNKYYRAKKRVAEIKKFYSSLMMYIVFIVFLGTINYLTNEFRYAWFLWAAFGWGIGIIFHAAKVFALNPFLGRNWEERKMKEFMKEEEENETWKL